MDNENIIDRLIKFMNIKNLNNNQITVECGLSNGLIGNAIKNRRGLHSDTIEKILDRYRDLNPVWFTTGRGVEIISCENKLLTEEQEIVKSNMVREPDIDIYKLRTDRILQEQFIPIYDLDASAGVITMFDDLNSVNPIDFMYLPNAPECDGGIFAFGDSMYPQIKSGDILGFKLIHDLTEDIYWGEKYVLYIDLAGTVFRTIKYVHRGEDDKHFKLVSENRHHADKEVLISKIKKIALVRAVIRY